jgi:N-acetyl-anhydromuramyl-L-alanine amidase AmpD
MKIVEQHLAATQYFRQVFPKKNIVLHHTVSSTAQSPLKWWSMQPERIGTAYVIAKDGTIIQCFDNRFWAHHLGLRHPSNLDFNRRSIGIELVNEGFLFPQKDGKRWLHPNGPIFTGQTIEAPWRNGSHWPVYPEEQVDACAQLVARLIQQYKMPVTFAEFGKFDIKIPHQSTVYAHHNVRADKTDTHPGFPYEKFKTLVHGYLNPNA